MSLIQLKKAIVSKVAQTEDEEVLRVIYKVLDATNSIYQLSEKERLIAEEAKAQYLRGETKSDEELQKELMKWLKS